MERLAEIERADCVIAANVAAYFTDDEYALFHVQVARLLAPGGTLVISHSNALFDLFTLNAFTVGFFRESFGVDPSPCSADRPSHGDPASTCARTP